jgi:5-methylcytosine-specific restriction endonuclease McrA
VFEGLVFEVAAEFFTPLQDQGTNLLEESLIESIDEQLSNIDKTTLLAQARAFDNSMAESYYISHGPKKIRKESQLQKRRVAKLEDYTCQLCGFKGEYVKHNGKKGWIIHVDHILSKADNNNENLNNLWTLCPNCHAKKTYGVIKNDLHTKTVTENGREVKLFCDHHLFI